MDNLFLNMKFHKSVIFTIILSMVFSCANKKDILYFQDINEDMKFTPKYKDYVIKIDDILKIDIITETPEAAQQFNLMSQKGNISVNKETFLLYGYQVDTQGYINFPELGKIMAKNKTILELREYIHNQIKDKDILTNPTVDIKLLNAHFTILGEVQNPGKYDFLKNNLNILEAIGMAGDLTINGVRDNIKLIRTFSGDNLIFEIDLTKSSIINGDKFQLFSGDIILVNQNSTRVKNAGIIGNSGTLISLLSFLLSSIILITN